MDPAEGEAAPCCGSSEVLLTLIYFLSLNKITAAVKKLPLNIKCALLQGFLQQNNIQQQLATH